MERAVLILWGVWLLLNLVAASRVFAYLIARRYQDKRWKTSTDEQKPAVVIIPVKGFDLQSTPEFFDTIFAQDYSSYRVIVTFESWKDPVGKWLSEEFEVTESSPVWKHPSSEFPLREVVLVAAGPALDEGQKVHNQRAAFEHLVKGDEVVVFADADISLGKDWLARLTAPINCGTHPLSTTYRWLVPKRPTLPNLFASVINGSITTQGGWEWSNVLWGGSMAMKRSVFDDLDVPELIEGSLNDDLRISKEARRQGNKIGFVRSLILPTTIDFTWSGFFEFAKRQYTQVKVFSPILYTGANILLGLYAIGVASVIASLIYGHFLAWVPLAAAYVIDQFRGLARQQVYLSLFKDESIRRKLFSTCWLEQMLTPVWMVMHWLIVVSTWTQTRIDWAGIRYRIISKSKTKVLERSEEEQTLPVGVPGLAMLASIHDLRRETGPVPIRPLTTDTEPVSVAATPASEESEEAEVETTEPPDSTEVTTTETPEEEPVEEEATDEVEVDDEAKAESESEPASESPADETPAPAKPAPAVAHPGVSSRVTPLGALPKSALARGHLAHRWHGHGSAQLREQQLGRGSQRVSPSSSDHGKKKAGPGASDASHRGTPGSATSQVRRSIAPAAALVASRIGPQARLIGAAFQTRGSGERETNHSPRPQANLVERARSKGASIPTRRFPTHPVPAASKTPVAAASSATTPASEAPASTPSAAPARPAPVARSYPRSVDPRPTRAARRPGRPSRPVGRSSGARPAPSGQVNLTSPARRGGGRNRPGSRGPSGRAAR